jgi:hypothetical protein
MIVSLIARRLGEATRPRRRGTGPATLALLASLVAGVAPPLAAAESDERIEAFLLEAEVVSMRALLSGISAPSRVVLRLEGVERNAIFKSVNVSPEDVKHSRDARRGFTDSYRYEIAAFRLDRLLGLDMVPVTVFRNVAGTPGSLQIWIEENVNEETRRQREGDSGDPAVIEPQLERMRFFDYLVANEDRNEWNLLYTPADWKLYLIDHSRAFRTKTGRPKKKDLAALAADPGLRVRLAALDREALEASLEGLLDGERLEALLSRRDRLLAALKP